ncbi:G-protein coupled receptor Mth2 isoform X7 [Leptinotarsa decemlineata]|uniref:G-protein coupled receptor Mth2 isoform X7 n=1 Tax=Leptinotarsa decemlineata TaxID=7539 RepID=UPI003D3079AE
MYFTPFFVILIYQTGEAIAAGVRCADYIDITDGQRIGTNITKNGLIFDENHYFIDGNSIKGCICDVKQCIRKCCPEGQKLNFTSKECVNDSDSDLSDFKLFHIIDVPKNKICRETKVKIIVDEFKVENGVLVTDFVTLSMNDFCITTDGGQSIAIGCVTNDKVPGILYAIGMIISMPFLLATFLVYALLPEPNLHRRALMSYVATLLMGYILLVSVQLSSEGISDVSCNLLGYLIIFFFTVSFFWMNVMCIDMWLAFRGMRSFGDRKGAERKRFIIYCCYAWGMPLVDILIIFLLNTYGDQTSSYYPAIGIQRCFVGEGLPNFLYFYLLAMLILIINIVLFILTGFKIHKVQRETSVLKHSDSKRHAYEDDKQQYKLYVKLLFAMGVNWITEIISWAIGYFWQETPKAVFYFTDFINATYGVFIFFIFVFKRKIWTSLKKRYYICIGKPHLAHAMSTTRGGTRTSNFSTTETGTSVHTDYRMNEMRNGKPEERALNRH